MTSARDIIELVRGPAALSVPGDAVAGAAAAASPGAPLSRRTAGLAAAGVCLYWAGMAANDWADRELDAVERPERPVPSGRVRSGTAAGIAAGLTAAGVALAGLAGGRRALAVAGVLAGAVWCYDLKLKKTPAGPAAMAACRGLDVLLGASQGNWRAALRPAFTVAAHTWTVTALSRREVGGGRPLLPAATLPATAAITLAATPYPLRASLRQPRPPEGIVAPATPLCRWLAGGYAAGYGFGQVRALARPEAASFRAAVAAGINCLPALQGALAARSAHPVAGAAIAACAPVAGALAQRSSPT